jgi:hypothetical protein
VESKGPRGTRCYHGAVRVTPAAFLVLASLLHAAQPARAPLKLIAPVQDKNFFVLSLFERTAPAGQAVAADPELNRLAQLKKEALSGAVHDCGKDLSCYTGALMWKPEEIETARASLAALGRANASVRRLAEETLRASGLYQRYGGSTADELLGRAWEDAARGINNIIEVYGAGKPPRYARIDSVSYDVKSAGFLLLVRTIFGVLEDDRDSLALFFQPSLRLAMMLLDANHRDEAGRLEPLDTGENREALARIRSIAWSRFPYSAIVVPGSGTDRLTFRLSAMGKLRLMLAARRFREGKAPLILVSGGWVHPVETPFAEAIEMKKALMTEFGIPAAAILVDPHARHTTTNLRNAARLIYRYGMPFDKPALITSDQDQSRAIESPEFAARCLRELGYQPGQAGRRISAFDLEFLPAVESLHADATDPLDP